MNFPHRIVPDWPAPSNVKAFTTLRTGGVSQAPFDSFNLATHVGDNPEAVRANRQLLVENAKLPQEPLWLKQVHGTTAVDLTHALAQLPVEEETIADASVSFIPNQISAVLTADCLPILLCDDAGSRVSAVHAGWRGLSQGVIGSAVEALKAEPTCLMAWLGPAIGPHAFEVGIDVKQAFPGPAAEAAFKVCGPEKWMADLYQLARLRLNALGVTRVFGGNFCTFTETERFFSFRRSNSTGRMASLIWLTD